jgi:hypothetical protein
MLSANFENATADASADGCPPRSSRNPAARLG